MSKSDYVSNNSFMTSQVKAPAAVPSVFGGDYVDPLEEFKKKKKEEEKQIIEPVAEKVVETDKNDNLPTYLPTNVRESSIPETQDIGKHSELTYLPTHTPTYLPTDTANQQPSSTIKNQAEIEKDWGKLPNSVKRWIAQGRFENSTLPIYIYLLGLTRMAIKRNRFCQVSKPRLLIGSGLKSERALLANIATLVRMRLIIVDIRNGDRRGNVFEVLTPDEVESQLPTYLPTDVPTYVNTPEQQVNTALKEVGSKAESPINTGSNEPLRYSFKDFKDNDDDALVDFRLVLDEASRRVTGKGLNSRHKAEWKKVAELLTGELERIEKNVKDPINNPPGLLAYHLDQLFFKAARTPKKEKAVAKKDTVGKGADEAEDYTIYPLTTEQREDELARLKMFITTGKTGMIADFRSYGEWQYTPEDFQWLDEQIKKAEAQD